MKKLFVESANSTKQTIPDMRAELLIGENTKISKRYRIKVPWYRKLKWWFLSLFLEKPKSPDEDEY